MFGETVGSLVVGTAVGEQRNIEWMESGDKGDEWIRDMIQLKKMQQPFKVKYQIDNTFVVFECLHTVRI